MIWKRSRWLADRTPELPGVYERFIAGTFARWTGAYWCSSRATWTAAAEANDKSTVQSTTIPWRGLAEQPK
jgi:hypothetical protein